MFKTYLISTAIFFTTDFIWLAYIGRSFYQKYLGKLLAPQPNWLAAISFYILFLVGLNYFAIWPAIKSDNWQAAALNGALFGFFTYMTYELTNMAVLKNWQWPIVFIDIFWGILLGAVVSFMTFFIYTSLK